MGSISLQIPQIGQPDTTEDVKVQNNFTTIQTAINGNIDTNNLNASAAVKDTQLASPNNAKRQLLMQAQATFLGGSSANTYVMGNGPVYLPGNSLGSVSFPIWLSDGGSNEFQVANKSAFCRIRGVVLVNTGSGAPGISFTMGMASINAVGGTGGNMTFTLNSVIAGSVVSVNGPSQSSENVFESNAFAMPADSTGYVLTAALSGSLPGSNYIQIASQLFCYNA